MPSNLRHSTTLSPLSVDTSYTTTIQSPPAKKQKKMTVTQTYRLAHTARGKLSSEASRGDHDLRVLVGHANLLDNLMVDLQDAEKEQEAWFNKTVAKTEEPKHIQWRDEVIEEVAEYDSDSDSDYSDEDEEEAIKISPISPRRSRSPPATVHAWNKADDEEDSDEEFDEDEHNIDLVLTRTHSHADAPHNPPELVHDSSDESEEEEVTTPPHIVVEKPGISAKDFASIKEKTVQDSFIQESNYFHEQTPMIAAC